MTSAVGEYTDWRYIDYRPAISELLPDALVPFLTPGHAALEVGCGRGAACIFLAQHGLDVLGIDINADAINAARQSALAEGFGSTVRFELADILDDRLFGTFDIVLMIRVLTCFPELSAWRRVLHRAHACLKGHGLIYVHDFLLAPANNHYQQRYEMGRRRGWRTGNFAVNDPAGRMLFVAHHHPRWELEEITAPYETLVMDFHESLSMNGNECRMFRFLGRKAE